MNEPAFAFHDLPADHFPFTVELISLGGDTLWSTTVDGPGALHVPGFPGQVGICRCRFANGVVVESSPEGGERTNAG